MRTTIQRRIRNLNTRRFTIFAFLCTTVCLIVVLSACDQIGQFLLPAPPQTEGLGGEIPIGFIVPHTGPLASSGLAMQQGTELAVAEINESQIDDVRIKLIVEDDGSTAEGAVKAANKLIYRAGVPVIIGPLTSSATSAVFPIARENQVVVISPTSAARGLSALYDFGFRVSLTVDKLVPAGVQITHQKLGYQRVAKIVDSLDLFSQSSDTMLAESLDANGVEILITATFKTGETDFSAQLTRIKNSNPDAIFISARASETPQILMQARQLGIPDDIPFIVPVTLISDQIQILGDAAEGTIVFNSWVSTIGTPGNHLFVQNYNTKYGVAPNTEAAQSYASVYILAAAIAKAQSTDSTAIRNALANTMDMDTILGRFSFNADGDAVYDPQVLIVKEGEFAVFE